MFLLGDEGVIRDGHRYFRLCCKDDTFQWTSVSNIVQLEHRTTNSGHGYDVSAQFISNAVSAETGKYTVLCFKFEPLMCDFSWVIYFKLRKETDDENNNDNDNNNNNNNK